MHAVLIYKVNFRGGSGGGWLIGKYLPYNKGEKRKKNKIQLLCKAKKKSKIETNQWWNMMTTSQTSVCFFQMFGSIFELDFYKKKFHLKRCTRKSMVFNTWIFRLSSLSSLFFQSIKAMMVTFIDILTLTNILLLLLLLFRNFFSFSPPLMTMAFW